MLRFSLQTWAGVVTSSIGSRLDQVLLIGLVSPPTLGIYAVAVTTAQVPMALFPALQRILLNRAARGHDSVSLVRASQLSAAFAMLVCLALLPVLPWVVTTLFGSAFEQSANLARILLVGTTLWGIGQSLSGLLIGVGLPGRASLADAAGLVALGATIGPLVAWRGSFGAAIAVVIGSAMTTVLKARFLAAGRPITASSLLLPSPTGLRRAASGTSRRHAGGISD
jgi:O-antigen/teichoic acid export membrane protein